MDFFDYWDQVRGRLEREFARWVPEWFDDLPARQNNTICRSLQGGKKGRGCLVCLTCEALGGNIEAAIPRAVAIECIQAASLIHDDYVDEDRVRRNHPAVWTVAGSRRAVLLADMMFATAMQKMMRIGLCDAEVVANAIATMAKGAYREYYVTLDRSFAIPKGMPPSQLYEQIIHLKTGTLFGAAAQLGVLAAGAPSDGGKRVFDFGARVGEAYQIADDLIDVRKLRKSRADMSPNILMLIPALCCFAGRHAHEVLAIFEETPVDMSRLSDEMLQVVESAMQQEISARSKRAVDELAGFPMGPYTQLLREMPHLIISRLLEPGAHEANRVTAGSFPCGR